MDLNSIKDMTDAMERAHVKALPRDAGYNKRWTDALRVEGYELVSTEVFYPTMPAPVPCPEGRPYVYPSQLKKIEQT